MTPPLTPTQLQALADLAKKATPGPYRWQDDDMIGGPVPRDLDDLRHYQDSGGDYNAVDGTYAYTTVIVTDSGYYPPRSLDRDYLAAVDPQTILALIAQLTTTQQRLAEVEKELAEVRWFLENTLQHEKERIERGLVQYKRAPHA